MLCSTSLILITIPNRSGKRKHPFDTNTDHRLGSSGADVDDDSGFCGSNLSSSVHKMVRFDDEMLLLKALMKEVNHEVIESNASQSLTTKGVMKANNHLYSSRSKNGKYELKILSQPEEQHRARYLTEGSRGAIKDKSGLSHPVVKLCGYTKSNVKIQCFIGHDKQLGSSHLFYQASKISGKNSTRCTTKRVDGTTLIVMEANPHNDMQVTVDCVGILKERNVDVEQKLTNFKNRNDGDNCGAVPTKKRSTRCRLVFRAQIPETNEILQVCDSKGGQELFIIGKNFLKDAKVVWKGKDWTKVVEPDKEYLHPTHMVSVIPSYDGPELNTQNSIEVSLSVKSGGKYSDAQRFTFIISEKAVNSDEKVNQI
ncbi:unnamed protein product [Oppiella nova]|uniref:RHD domain-containing protein n=1 Tax=Oppiella nova TaxID=334625 RepID=A0A7R9LGI2_9ACAR|nr:unnamed protein product [Oppiella nova]CAG2163445.1 unnamed protein product [Oppiella nova]